MKQERCDNCKFWKLFTVSKGLCRRNPPSVGYAGEDRDEFNLWPETFRDDWCGEYKSIDSIAEVSANMNEGFEEF